jgi:glycosyltransferase involved in cell wall biosynthesis
MRIVFLPANCLPFHGKTLDERPLGGTETGVIRLAEALQDAGHQVFVVSQFENPPLTEPLYIPLRAIFFLGQIDLLIGVRDWQSIFTDIPARKKLLWTGDAYDQPLTVGIGDRRIMDRLDGLLCVSEWQKQTLCEVSGFPLERTFVIRNGIDASYFSTVAPSNNRKRLIYSSTPYRGLKHIIDIFKGVQEKVHDAECCICSGYDVYGGAERTPSQQLEELATIRQALEPLPGVIWRGNILQQELAHEMLHAGIYAYPCTFAETSCISILEAKAAGVVPITNSLGALPETVGQGGIILQDATAITPQVRDQFITTIAELMLDKQRWHALSSQALLESKETTWHHVATRLMSFCS